MKAFVAVGCLCLFQVVSSFNLQAPLSSSPTSRHVKISSTKLNLYASVEEAIAEAQRICAMNPDSQECRVAWDIVEELEAADSHRDGAARQAVPEMTGPGVLNMSPDLVALVASFDILAQKIDGKMDQLMATTEKLQELGASDPAIEELKARAGNMREILACVNEDLKRQV